MLNTICLQFSTVFTYQHNSEQIVSGSFHFPSWASHTMPGMNRSSIKAFLLMTGTPNVCEPHSLVTNPALPSCLTLRCSITDLTSLPANWVLLQNTSNVQGSKTSMSLPRRFHECWPQVILFKFWFLVIYKCFRCNHKLFNPVPFLFPLRQPLSC